MMSEQECETSGDEEANESKNRGDADQQTVCIDYYDASIRNDIFGNLSVTCQTEIMEYCNVTTETDSKKVVDVKPGIGDGDATDASALTNGIDDACVKELEKRCSEYQTEVKALRTSLEQSEKTKAKFSEDILNLLNSGFVIDGQQALATQRPPAFETEHVTLSALRQLASIWKERDNQKFNLIGGQADQCADTTSSNNVSSSPSNVDSLGLETKLVSASQSPFTKIKTTCSSSTQSEEQGQPVTFTGANVDEEVLKRLKSGIFTELQETWLKKEKDWIGKIEDKENQTMKLQADLERLQNHLVDLEEQYTVEALAAEEKEKQLRLQIAGLQNRIAQTVRQNDKNGDVREEIVRLTSERDCARASSASLEEQIQNLNSQLLDLHFVLEQFQTEKEVETMEVRRNMQQEMRAVVITNQQLRRELDVEKGLLCKARSGLEAAQRLNSQLEDKVRLIRQLKHEVQEKEVEVERLAEQLDEINSNNVAKIDRFLVKNLIVGYFTTPSDKRMEVLRVIATVLDFNGEDRQKTGLESTSTLAHGREAHDGGPDWVMEESFVAAFVRFLESESQPETQIRIPFEEIIRRNSLSSGSSSSDPGEAGPTISSFSNSGIPEMSLNLPVLDQADRSNSILKDVLSPRSCRQDVDIV